MAYTEAATNVVGKLAQYVSQWKDISLCLSVDCLQPLLELQGTEAPFLQSFCLSHIAFGSPDYWTSSWRGNMKVPDISIVPLTIQPGPKLRVLRLDIPQDTLRLAPFWTELEELIMVPSPSRRSQHRPYFTGAAALKMLCQFPQLKRCTLSVTDHPWSPPVEEELEPLTMSQLTMLSLQASTTPLLQALTLPALRRLKLHRKCDVPTLRSFLAGLSQPLVELSLVRIPEMTDDELFSCLELIPTVTHLHITAPVGPLSLRALTPSDNGSDSDASSLPCLCPDLDYIEVRCWRPFDALVDMVEARCDAFRRKPRTLRVRLHLHSKPIYAEGASENEAGLLGRLERCRDRGFDVKWQL